MNSPIRVGLFASMIVFHTLSADIVWNAFWNTTEGKKAWSTAESWRDGIVRGTNPSDNVDLSAPFPVVYSVDATKPYTTTYWGTSVSLGNLTAVNIHSITSLPFQTICRIGEYHGSFTIVDPSPFRGIWSVGGLQTPKFYVNPESGNIAEFQRFANGFRTEFHVADSSKAYIRDLLGFGMIANSGAGELVVNTPRSLKARIILEGTGALTIKAQDEYDVSAPAEGALWHFDASDAATFKTMSVEGDSRIYVTNWVDVAGRDVEAYIEPGIESLGVPFVSSEKFNGRNMIDFGGYINNKLPNPYYEPENAEASFGKASCLALSPKGKYNRYTFNRNPIYEAFVVIKGHASVTGWVGYLGNASQYSFCGALQNNKFVDPQYSVIGSNACGEGNYRLWLDGQPMLAHNYQHNDNNRLCEWDPTDIHVLSFSFGEGSRPFVTSFGSSRGYQGREAGGFMLGEAIVYTNALTDAQRRQTTAYLMKRWLPGTRAKPFDVDAVIVGNKSASINVDSGDVTKVRTLRLANNIANADGAKVIKKGDGVLELEEVMPKAARIEVEGGSIMLSHDTPEAFDSVDNVPVNGMICWLDAENSTIEGSDDSVVKWLDRRTDKKDSVFASVYPETLEVFPKRILDEESGLHLIDYGENVKAENPAGVIKDNGSNMKNVKEMFVVWRRNGTDNNSGLLWDGDRYGGVTASPYNDVVIAPNYCYSISFGTLWSVDGEPRETTSSVIKDFSDAGNGKLSVVNMSLMGDGLKYCYLALSGWARTTTATRGGCSYGEIICYNRMLSDAERRNVTAYLMKKWKRGAKLPLDGDDTISEIAFKDGVAPRVGTRTDRTLEKITGSGTFTKNGAGKLTIHNVDSKITSLNVDKGTLAVKGDREGDGSTPIYESVQISKGAVLEVVNTTPSSVTLSTISGEGTIKTESLVCANEISNVEVDGDLSFKNGAAINLELYADGSIDTLKVKGNIDSSAQVTVNLTVPDGYKQYGQYKIIDCASNTETIDVSKWIVNEIGLTNWNFVLVVDKGGVTVCSVPPSLMIIVK